MPKTDFEYVLAISDPAKCGLQVVRITGLSTKHADTRTDSGRLYGSVGGTADAPTLDVYSQRSRQSAQKVMAGTSAGLGLYFDLTEANASGMSGEAVVSAFTAADPDVVLVPTFAVDRDVMINGGACSTLPSFDPVYGLAEAQAQAVKQILTADLPARLPHLYGAAAVAAIVPGGPPAGLPDLRKIIGIDHLRIAQGALAKAKACQQAEHVEEFANMAELAMERYTLAMDAVAAANPAEESAAETFDVGPSVATWSRI